MADKSWTGTAQTLTILPVAAALVALLVSGCGADSVRAGLVPDDAHRGDAALRGAEMGLDGSGENVARLHLTGGARFDGKLPVSCGPLGGHGSFHLALASSGEPVWQLTLDLDGFHGEGSYEARATLSRADEAGTLVESRGDAKVTVAETSNRAGQHKVTGSFSASFRGAAGEGSAEGTFRRCYYFD